MSMWKAGDEVLYGPPNIDGKPANIRIWLVGRSSHKPSQWYFRKAADSEYVDFGYDERWFRRPPDAPPVLEEVLERCDKAEAELANLKGYLRGLLAGCGMEVNQ